VAIQHEPTRPAAAGDEDARLRELVLGYLDEHPTAMDTLDGIAEWWIRRQQIEIEVRRVSSVLQSLVQQGVLEEAQQSGVRFFRRRSSGVPRTAPLAERAQ
jgi:hypothetical protein